MGSLQPDTVQLIRQLAKQLQALNKRKHPYFNLTVDMEVQQPFPHFLRAAVLVADIGVPASEFVTAVHKAMLKRGDKNNLPPYFLYSHRTIVLYKSQVEEEGVLRQLNKSKHLRQLMVKDKSPESRTLLWVFRKYLTEPALNEVADVIELDDEDTARLAKWRNK